MKFLLPLISFVVLTSFSAHAQNVIKVQIDHGGLHCPYLTPRFEDRFSELTQVDSVWVDRTNSIGYLYLQEGTDITDEEISEIIVHKVGYPVREIKAIIRNED
jgi:hypothetical protein